MNSTLFILALLTGVAAVELHQHSAVEVASHAASHATSKRARSKASKVALRGVAEDANALQDDDDDDDDDDDEEETPAPVTIAIGSDPKVSDKTAAASMALFKGVKEESTKAADAAAEKEKREEEEAAMKQREAKEEAMNDALRKQTATQNEVKLFKDDIAFDAKIAAQTKIITNETQSPALASFLGDIRTEMRQ